VASHERLGEAATRVVFTLFVHCSLESEVTNPGELLGPKRGGSDRDTGNRRTSSAPQHEMPLFKRLSRKAPQNTSRILISKAIFDFSGTIPEACMEDREISKSPNSDFRLNHCTISCAYHYECLLLERFEVQLSRD
jgi:hypothetical protein